MFQARAGPDRRARNSETARDEGFDEIADWFETLANAEKSHAGRFQRALDDVK